MEIDFSSLLARLKSEDKILILTHMNPDGDTLGSAFALLRILRKMGKKAKVYCSDKIPEKFSYLYENVENEDFTPEFIMSVDVADIKLLGAKEKDEYKDKIDLSIDHHEKNRLFAKESYVESDSASNSEIIFLIAEAFGVMDEEIANCIYTGVTTDTGCFRYSNVTSRTHKIAGKLIDYGADHSRINVKMFETKSKNYLSLEKYALQNLELFCEDKLAFISVSKKTLDECGCEESDLDGICAIPRQIEGVKVGITLKEKADGTISASVRTGEEVSASDICARFGGGGHNRAAGCKFSDDMNIVKEKLIAYISKEIL